ncbi:MAG: peroxide stress protein YaaA [Acidimicrobiia bacterium]|nr:peroxide stress protein YaaA [Acidimicrobiia bacterium]
MSSMPPLTILLPPSEGKTPGGDGPPWTPASGRYGRSLGEHRGQVAAALAEADGGDAALLGAKGDLLERARAANRAVVGAPTLPAWRRYEGVVWEHLDLGSLSSEARATARRSVLVVSALTGVSGVADPLPDHRLKLSVRLGDLGRLDRWWRPVVSDTLDRALRGRLVIDLLPNEHRAAWEPDPQRYDLRRVRFTDGSGAAIGHGAKAAKGLLARALLGASDPEALLDGWSHGPLRAEVEA